MRCRWWYQRIEGQTRDQGMNLIECGEHGMAPGCVICTHLAEGASNEWHPVDNGEATNEGASDWLCPRCFSKMTATSLDDIRTVCLHCVRRLQQRPGTVIVSAP